LTLGGVNVNAWEAVNVTLTLDVPSNGGKLNVPGFHFSNGTEWKVRFAPAVVGSYAYTLDVERFGEQLHSSTGTLECSASDAKGWLRPQYDTYPYRSVYEGDGTLYSGSGIGDCITPDLTFPTLNETTQGQYTRTLEQYLNDYKDFSYFRWSDNNCAFSILKGLDGNPCGAPHCRNGNKYSEGLSHTLDTFLGTVREHGYSVWYVPFERYHKLPPFPNAGDHWTPYHQAQREGLARYLEYVVGRYGAYVDVWSLDNEGRNPDNWIVWVAEYLRSIDPYQHPISVSWNRPDLDQIEINEVHWYSGDAKGTEWEDAATASTIADSLKWNKPVYYTETGNKGHNWDWDSHTRMRIRTWTMFFRGATLMWWNTAGMQNCTPCGGGNMYLGPTEIGYQKTYVDFAGQMIDPAVKMFNLTLSEGVRAYGLEGASGSATMRMVYVTHTDHSSNTTAQLVFPEPSVANCAGEWVYPETGVTVAASPFNGTTFETPLFNIDIALKVLCQGGSVEYV
jgi:hypothetical protein